MAVLRLCTETELPMCIYGGGPVEELHLLPRSQSLSELVWNKRHCAAVNMHSSGFPLLGLCDRLLYEEFVYTGNVACGSF